MDLQQEIEVLATKLEAAAEEGCDEEEIAELETQLGTAVEALVTLEEAKTQIAAMRKDLEAVKSAEVQQGEGGLSCRC